MYPRYLSALLKSEDRTTVQIGPKELIILTELNRDFG